MQLTQSIGADDRYLDLDEPYIPSSLFSYVQIGSEVMLVGNGVGTNRIKVRRAQIETTAASHTSGTAVEPVTDSRVVTTDIS